MICGSGWPLDFVVEILDRGFLSVFFRVYLWLRLQFIIS